MCGAARRSAPTPSTSTSRESERQDGARREHAGAAQLLPLWQRFLFCSQLQQAVFELEYSGSGGR
jgi:hypothetical protein